MKSVASACVLGISLVFLVVLFTDTAKIRTVVGETELKFTLNFFVNEMIIELQDKLQTTRTVKDTYCTSKKNSTISTEKLQKKICDKSKRLQGFSIAAIILNALVVAFAIFLIWKPFNHDYKIFLVILTGLLICTCGMIAYQVNLTDFFIENEFTELNIQISSSYASGFYFSIVCLLLEIVVVCGCVWFRDKKSYSTLITSL